MQFSALAFLSGILVCQQLVILPSSSWTWLLMPLFVLTLLLKKLRPLLLLASGFLWALLIAHDMLSRQLDTESEGVDLRVSGFVSSLPKDEARRTRFEFTIDELQEVAGIEASHHQKQAFSNSVFLLSWYNSKQKPAPEIHAGEYWQLRVRVKRPHGFMNPGGMDYEGWLFQKGIMATGYVRVLKRDIKYSGAKTSADTTAPVGTAIVNYQTDPVRPGLLQPLLLLQKGVLQIRESLQRDITTTLPEDPFAGMIRALAIGDRGGITPEQWQVLTRTGTSHLVAISGLHIGLVAGLVFFAARRLWSLSARAVLRMPAPVAAAIFAIAAAVVYAALAGFTVPTQRALVMVVVVMLAIVLRRNVRPANTLAAALMVVLLLDPLSVNSAGFWLSFGAVAIILYGMSGRLHDRLGGGGGSTPTVTDTSKRLYWQWGRVQWLVVIGLAPIMLVFFQQLSLVAPVANLLAVPWVSLVTVPLTLLGSLFLQIVPALAPWVLKLATLSLDVLWWFLAGLANLELARWVGQTPPLWTLATSLVGIVWLLAPKGFPGRRAGIVWLLPLVFLPQTRLPDGQVRFTLLDVGQGLAAVVQTRNHVLVFDAGPRFSRNFDTGRSVIAPWLQHFGIGEVDMLVVSHGDNDHSGGARSLTEEVPVVTLVSSVPEKIKWRESQLCSSTESWHWDGVRLQFLHPGQVPFPGDGRGNNRSCVLRVSTQSGSILLSADIEAEAEQQILSIWQDTPDLLQADVLVVPHHGSKTSSTEAFVQAVNPKYALFPAGYRNRYGFPKQTVVDRYLQKGSVLLNTADNGAIEFLLDEQGTTLTGTWRQDAGRYWHTDVTSREGKPAINVD